ncbi:VWA domain-containing protein [Spongiactinospora sp. TRM90649]|uniref:VWA domain-containing protein n=1 Tax=Spongiactinospora sp. TRM90649 TaxID=3031114 RepID=UPI0023F8C763|nr:VWA domain-containing protein [Spongiactinospora sp. TRM90649]MDF5758094.1 VWA domain-containing protein [Spongiactinospora sp. TRM90649]
MRLAIHRLAAALVTMLGTTGVAVAADAPRDAVAAARDEPAPVMLVLDASGSMAQPAADGETKMAAARRAVRSVVEGLPADARLGLTVYGTGTGNSDADKPAGCRDVKVLHEVGTPAAELVATADDIGPRGYTPIGRALRAAAGALPSEGPRSIVLVSDGEDTCAPPDPCEVAAELAENGADLRVHTIGFDVDAKTKKQLACVAQQTGGSYTDAADARDLAPALDRVTGIALRNYEPTGTPARGADSPEGAPLLRPGDHLDQIDTGEAKYYTIDVPPGNTAWFGATGVFPAASSARESVMISRYTPDGTRCAWRDTGHSSAGDPVVPLVRSWTTADGADARRPCDRPGRFVVMVERETRPATGDPAWLELGVRLEAPVPGDPGPARGTDEVAFAEPSGDAATDVTGGGSFATAGTLSGPGRYADTVHPGEYVFYRVRLDWGQGLAYRVRLPESAEFGARVLTKTYLYGPARAQLAESGTVWYDGRTATLPPGGDAMATRPVRYLNRELTATRGQAVAGWYYIAVKYGSRPTLRGEVAYPPVEIGLDVSVTGEPEPGPAYETAPAVPPSSDPRPSAPATEPPTRPAPSPANGGAWGALSDAGPVVWAGVPLALLALAGLIVILVRRRPR